MSVVNEIMNFVEEKNPNLEDLKEVIDELSDLYTTINWELHYKYTGRI
jgi:hypothetical protein